MKTPFRLGGIAALIAFPFATALLGSEAEPLEAIFVVPVSPETKSYQSTGEYAIDRLMMTLLTDSANAVAQNQEVQALPTFHLKDLPMKNGTVGGLPRIKAMKLTSQKLRNPANAPDAAEKLALRKVQLAIENGSVPRLLLQRITWAENQYEWRVYKPLPNARQCGTCHAPAEQQSPELRAALSAKYPTDESSAYETGEWRGLIRVTVAEPPPSTSASN